jgi:hypothetical protein
VIPLRRKLTAIAEQRQADDAVVVLEHATENARAELALSSLAGAYVQFGFTLTELARIADSENVEEGPPLAYEPAALAAITARIAVRQELRLPKRECVVRKPSPRSEPLQLPRDDPGCADRIRAAADPRRGIQGGEAGAQRALGLAEAEAGVSTAAARAAASPT